MEKGNVRLRKGILIKKAMRITDCIIEKVYKECACVGFEFERMVGKNISFLIVLFLESDFSHFKIRSHAEMFLSASIFARNRQMQCNST